MEGQVVDHPLADWKALESYQPPDFMTRTERGERNWEKIRRTIKERRKKGLLTLGDGERLFDRLYFLRGFGNPMLDIVRDEPHLPKTIRLLQDHETELINKWLEFGVDIISFHTDIGTQHGLMMEAEFYDANVPLENIEAMCQATERFCIGKG